MEQVERVAEGPPAAERAAAVAAWSGCGPEASASASAGRDSILSNLTAENDATTKGGWLRPDEDDGLRPCRVHGIGLRRRRGDLGVRRTQRLLLRNPRRLAAQARQRVEQTGARLEVDRRRHRERHLLLGMVVERGAPQVSGTHRSCDKCRQPDRIRRQHGQQCAAVHRTASRQRPARELDAVLAVLLRAVEGAVRRPEEPVDGLRLAELGDAEAGGDRDLLTRSERDLKLGQRAAETIGNRRSRRPARSPEAGSRTPRRRGARRRRRPGRAP